MRPGGLRNGREDLGGRELLHFLEASRWTLPLWHSSVAYGGATKRKLSGALGESTGGDQQPITLCCGGYKSNAYSGLPAAHSRKIRLNRPCGWKRPGRG